MTPPGQIFPDYAIEARVISDNASREPQIFNYRSAHYSNARGTTELHRRLLAALEADSNSTPTQVRTVLAEVQTWATAQLPSHMQPPRFEAVVKLPLNNNGKLDRRALLQRAEAARNAPPATVTAGSYKDPLEAALAELWCRVLGRTTLGRDEEFFNAGGDSILAVRLTTEVQRWLDDAVFLAALFDAPTVSQYAEWLRTYHAPAVSRRLAASPAPVPQSAPEPRTTVPTLTAPLTSPQQSLWILQQLYPHSTAANEQFLIRVAGGADSVHLRRAWHAVLGAHDILRTAIVGSAASPQQVVVSLEQCIARDATPVIDLQNLSAAAADAELRSAAAADISRVFDLAVAPLLRTRLYRMPSAEIVLLVTAHHIVADGLCVGLIRDALAVAYKTGSLPRPTLQYADYSVQQARQTADARLDSELAWWQTQLAGHDRQLLSGHPVLPVGEGRERRVEFSLTPQLGERLRVLARAENATLFMLLLAAWRAWLQRCFALDDVLIGSPVTLRRDAATDAMLGCMVNNVVFRNSGSSQRSFRELLRAEREAALAAYEQSLAPFEKVVEALQPRRTLGRHPLFQVLFMFEDRTAPPAQAGALRFSSDVLPVDRASYWDLELSVTDCGSASELPAFIGIRTDLFDVDALVTWPEGFIALLEALATDPDAAVGALPVLSPLQQQQMLVDWNATQLPIAPADTLHGLFAAQAARTPEHIAVCDVDEQLTYADLQQRAARYAAVLADCGINHGARVALAVKRSADCIALLLAVLQRGACWLPLDPAYPAARLALMIEDAQPDLIVSETALQFASNNAVLQIDELRTRAAAYKHPVAASVDCTAADPAYILFTSGSTGRPKGALSVHAGAVSRCLWMWREFAFTPDAIFAQRTSLNFVDSIWEIFGPLLHGARVVVLPAEHEHDAVALLGWLQREQITHLVTVPVLLNALLQASAGESVPTALRSLISSGEALTPALARRCAELWSGVELFNTYGTSETWDASFYRVRNQDADARSIAIGTPVANAALYILDAHGQPVPPGVTGELHVGGLALAREYVSNPELTRARFIPNPFITDPGARLYRTGDLACYQADGNVILAGRADRQIKLRGLRIEAGDIEGRALEFTGVRQCALRLQQPVAGDPWLALYVVAAGALNTEDLRAYLQAGLPRALVPADICVLDSLPLTPSGKVDLHALPMMPAPVAVGNYVAPRNAVEEQLAMIWSRALGCDRVGVHDDFFMLRGHSLLAVQVIARICDEFAVELPLHALFEAPTVAGLARNISALRWTQTQHSSAANLPDEREVLRL